MSVVVIGGGVAGLACGCYLQMNGYASTILEAKSVPGGLCVAWARGAYLFDGCMRWLVGVDTESTFGRIWRELGAIQGRKVLRYEEFLRVETASGLSFAFTSDLNKFAADAKRVSPSDAKHIDKLVKAAKRCANLDPPAKPLELMTALEKTRLLAKYLPMLLTAARWKDTSIEDYTSEYTSPVLREVLKGAAGDPRMSAVALIMLLGLRGRDNVGYVAGGSRALVEALTRRYKSLGGQIRFNCEVDEITVEQGRAAGVVCKSREHVPARHVVACADGRTVLYQMLGGQYLNARLRKLYEHGHVFPPLVQVSIGIRNELNESWESMSLPMPPAIQPNDRGSESRLEISLLAADCELCPPGKTVVLARFASSFEFWSELKRRDVAAYEAEKERVLREVLRFLDARFPGFAGAVEQTDVATPCTFARYTGNHNGSCQGWLPTPGVLDRPIPQRLPGLKNFYMAGHWVQAGGGLPPAALSGRYAAQLICAADGREFTTNCA